MARKVRLRYLRTAKPTGLKRYALNLHQALRGIGVDATLWRPPHY